MISRLKACDSPRVVRVHSSPTLCRRLEIGRKQEAPDHAELVGNLVGKERQGRKGALEEAAERWIAGSSSDRRPVASDRSALRKIEEREYGQETIFGDVDKAYLKALELRRNIDKSKLGS